MRNSFEYVTTLEYRLKAVSNEVAAFKSGEKYIQLEKYCWGIIRKLEAKIKKLEQELAKAHAETVTVRNYWFDVVNDMDHENQKEMNKVRKLLKNMEKRALTAEKQRDDALDKITEQRQEIYRLGTELEEEKGKNQKLTAQLNHNYENSSIPSSMTLKKKKVANSREKSGRKQGAQPGHKGYGRKKHTPTETILLPAPEEVLNNSEFKKTKKTIIKQVVGIRLLLDVTEYHADVYYNSKTGERIHAPFPDGVVNDVNYDGSIKAFLFLLNNECCVSIDKCQKFLEDLTNGELKISRGMINGLSKEFSKKTAPEQKELFETIMAAPVMHIDCTNARVNGQNAYVFVTATPNGEVLYSARHKKGHEGVKGTPAEDYNGIIVHDHEKTFYKYGSAHQECLAHVERYLKDATENEKDKTWSGKMRSLLKEMIHYRNGLLPEEECSKEKVKEYEEKYLEILNTAKEEYEYEPPSDYYRDGFNLYKRMYEYMENHLLFLHDNRVPTTNNEAERDLRSYKRKQKQAMSFRSFESIEYLCQSMSMLLMMRKKDDVNLFDSVSKIFG